jgi:hypothetical protein
MDVKVHNVCQELLSGKEATYIQVAVRDLEEKP